MNNFKSIKAILSEVRTDKKSHFKQTSGFVQHGNTSVMKHCISVAYVSLMIAKKLHIKVDRKALVRGALLHDYFLYDWHEKNKEHSLHGFKHPYFALRNASRDFRLNDIEKNVIVRHMFPLTPICLLYTSDAADEEDSGDIGGSRITKKKKKEKV